MNISHFCIDRPIFASVHIHRHHAGGRGGDVQPARRPVSRTSRRCRSRSPPPIPGASAEVVAQNVAAPIEQQVNGADRLIYMSSTSSSAGLMTMTAFFEIGTDPSLAQVDVQNRVSLALPQLPLVGAIAGRLGAEEVLGVHDGHLDLLAGRALQTRPTSPTTRASTCSTRSSAYPGRGRRPSSARPTTPCASG